MINVTPMAASKITELLTEENKVGAGLRVFVQGGGCSGFQYGLMIEEGEAKTDADQTVESNGVRSEVFKLEVVDLPFVKQLDLTLNFPAHARMPAKNMKCASLRVFEGLSNVSPTLKSS